MVFGLPAIGETSWGQKVLDSINAVKATADAALPASDATASYARIVNVAANGVSAGANGDAAFSAILATATAGDTLVFPASASDYQFSARHDIPDGVTVQFSKPEQAVTVTGDTGFLRLGNRARVVGNPAITGAGQAADSKCIDLQSSKADQYVEATCVAWRGYFVHGVASIRPKLVRVKGTVSAGAGTLIRLTTGNTDGWNGSTGPVVDPRLEDCHAVSCVGTGIQLDGDWNHITWRTAGNKVENPVLIGCSGVSSGWAGVFVNSATGGHLVGCWGDNNGDYGVGAEYCQDLTLVSCRGDGNTYHGVSIQSNAERCSLIGCTGTSNASNGLNLSFSNLITTGGSDTVGSDNRIIGCGGEGNTVYDLGIAGGMVATKLSGNVFGTFNDGGSGTVTEGTGVPFAARNKSGVGTWSGPPGGRGTVTHANGVATAYPLFVPTVTAVSYMAANVTSAGGAGSVIRMGIYRDNNGRPDALVYDAGTVTADTTGNRQVNLAATQTLQPGTYWLVAAVQGAPTPDPTVTTATDPGGQVNFDSAFQALAGAVGFYSTGVTGALPASFLTGFGGATTDPIAVATASA